MIKKLVIFSVMISLHGCTDKEVYGVQVKQEMTKIQTHCLGRTLIDLPLDFQLSDGSSARFVQGSLSENQGPIEVLVQSRNFTEENFRKKVSERRTGILESADKTTGALKEGQLVEGNVQIFNVQTIEDSYSTELHALIDGNYVIFKTKSYKNEYSMAELRLLKIWANTRKIKVGPASDNRYCLGNLAIYGKFKQESSHFLFRSIRILDVNFVFDTNTFVLNEEETLLQRVDGPNSLLRKFNVDNHVMRKGELKVASMKAQEWLSWVVLGDGGNKKKQYGFAFETMRSTPSLEQPRIHVELDSGQTDAGGIDQPNSLSDDEAIVLWDSVIKSIRSNTSNSQQ